MKTQALRAKTAQDLEKELHGLLEEQFKLRMQKPSGQMAKTHLLKVNRRGIARIKTLLKEKVTK